MTTARNALRAAQIVAQQQADAERAIAIDVTEGDAISRATANGAAAAFQALATMLAKDVATVTDPDPVAVAQTSLDAIRAAKELATRARRTLNNTVLLANAHSDMWQFLEVAYPGESVAQIAARHALYAFVLLDMAALNMIASDAAVNEPELTDLVIANVRKEFERVQAVIASEIPGKGALQ